MLATDSGTLSRAHDTTDADQAILPNAERIKHSHWCLEARKSSIVVKSKLNFATNRLVDARFGKLWRNNRPVFNSQERYGQLLRSSQRVTRH